MALRPLALFLALLVLSACTTGGYQRPYIITDTTDAEIISEQPAAKR